MCCHLRWGHRHHVLIYTEKALAQSCVVTCPWPHSGPAAAGWAQSLDSVAAIPTSSLSREWLRPAQLPSLQAGWLVWAGQKGQSLLSVPSLLVTALNAGPASQSAGVTLDLSLPRNSRWPRSLTRAPSAHRPSAGPGMETLDWARPCRWVNCWPQVPTCDGRGSLG